MDIERAFRRREALQQRLATIERDGYRLTAMERPKGSSVTCSESASFTHMTRPDGTCAWCGRRVDPPAPRPSMTSRPDIDIEDVIDRVTLEPVDPHDRDGYKEPGASWDVHGAVKVS